MTVLGHPMLSSELCEDIESYTHTYPQTDTQTHTYMHINNEMSLKINLLTFY